MVHSYKETGSRLYCRIFYILTGGRGRDSVQVSAAARRDFVLPVDIQDTIIVQRRRRDTDRSVDNYDTPVMDNFFKCSTGTLVLRSLIHSHCQLSTRIHFLTASFTNYHRERASQINVR